jgi:hypothetical protein
MQDRYAMPILDFTQVRSESKGTQLANGSATTQQQPTTKATTTTQTTHNTINHPTSSSAGRNN